MIYKIITILKNGAERTDGLYPNRIGSTGTIWYLEIGGPLFFSYLKDADGNSKSGTIVTSTVEDIFYELDRLYVDTLNSTYLFELVTDGEDNINK